MICLLEIPWALIDKLNDGEKLYEKEVKKLYILKELLERAIKLKGNRFRSASIVLTKRNLIRLQ